MLLGLMTFPPPDNNNNLHRRSKYSCRSECEVDWDQVHKATPVAEGNICRCTWGQPGGFSPFWISATLKFLQYYDGFLLLLDEEHTEPPKELERASDRIL